jgi:hypothetical protein
MGHDGAVKEETVVPAGNARVLETAQFAVPYAKGFLRREVLFDMRTYIPLTGRHGCL